MRSLGSRRAAMLTGAATVAVIALTGCSAGQVAETAILQAPVSGLNTQSPDGRVLIRNLQVLYNNPQGYPADGAAPLEVSLFNQSEQAVTVLISSRPPQSAGDENVITARQVGMSGGTPMPGNSDQVGEPSAGPSAAAPGTALQPARITIAPLSSAVFLPGGQQTLQATGLSGQLAPGGALSLVFEVSGSSQPIEVLAPVAIPLSPASRVPGAPPNENAGEGE